MEYTISPSKEKYHKAALSVVNCFLKLTDFELDLIAEMLNNDITILDKNSRRKLRDILHTDVYTFNNYIKRLKERKYLIDTANGLQLQSAIVAAANNKEIKITINVHN